MPRNWPRHNENRMQHRRTPDTNVWAIPPCSYRFDRCTLQISHRPTVWLNCKIVDPANRAMYAAYYSADICIPIQFAATLLIDYD